jgi:DNA (cytosine-5)-methyltransferase 1
MAAVRRATGTNGMTAASLFAGCGGSSLGYRLAGFRVGFAVEWAKKAPAEVYRLNMDPATELRVGDVREVKGKEILAAVGGRLDVLDGSPPCQDFSTAGKRDLSGERPGLYYEAVRLVGEARPRAFAFENVKGFVAGDSLRLHYRPIVRALEGHGYRVAGQVLDASWLGVPQARERVVLIGFREDEGVDPASAFPVRGSRRTPMSDAMPGVRRVVKEERKASRVGLLERRKGETWLAHRPLPTITRGGLGDTTRDAIWAEEMDGRLRRLTAAELKALSSFPRDFKLGEANLARTWEMMGNAVPPLMAYAWACGVRDALLGAESAAA